MLLFMAVRHRTYSRLKFIFQIAAPNGRMNLARGAMQLRMVSIQHNHIIFASLSFETLHMPDGLAVIVLSLVCANIRNCSRPSSKVKALDVLLALAPFLTDESKLDRLVPYVIELLRDDAALVRASAIRTLTQVVGIVLSPDLLACITDNMP